MCPPVNLQVCDLTIKTMTMHMTIIKTTAPPTATRSVSFEELSTDIDGWPASSRNTISMAHHTQSSIRCFRHKYHGSF